MLIIILVATLILLLLYEPKKDSEKVLFVGCDLAASKWAEVVREARTPSGHHAKPSDTAGCWAQRRSGRFAHSAVRQERGSCSGCSCSPSSSEE